MESSGDEMTVLLVTDARYNSGYLKIRFNNVDQSSSRMCRKRDKE